MKVTGVTWLSEILWSYETNRTPVELSLKRPLKTVCRLKLILKDSMSERAYELGPHSGGPYCKVIYEETMAESRLPPEICRGLLTFPPGSSYCFQSRNVILVETTAKGQLQHFDAFLVSVAKRFRQADV